MKIELIDSMGDDLRIANIARVSFNKWKEELDNKDASLIKYLATHEHSSPFRHTCVSIRCKAPIFIARQLGKHQVGLTWNEVSRRYVDAGIEFFVPNSWRGRPANGIKQGSSEIKILSLYSPEHDYLGPVVEQYEKLLSSAVEIYEAMIYSGVAPEQARMILPQSMMTEWVWTGSLPAFFHVYRLRINNHAQKEVRDFAALLEEIVQPLFPVSWSALKGE